MTFTLIILRTQSLSDIPSEAGIMSKPNLLMHLIFDMLNSHSSRPEPSALKAK